YEHLRGVRFYQFEGDRTTLLLDTRRGRLTASLLAGAGHRVHHALRRARTEEAILAEVRFEEPLRDLFDISARDLTLTQVAASLGAEMTPSRESEGGLREFLADLAERWITFPIDGRHITLAIDCTRSEHAAPHGLGEFVRTLQDRPPTEKGAP